MPNNDALRNAKIVRNDEFYTTYACVENEVNAYFEYDHNVFRGKTILLPCDDPETSNFTKYFAANFDRFGLKKLISTSYAKGCANKFLTSCELKSTLYDKSKYATHGKLYIVTRDELNHKTIDTDDILFSSYLEGDGDFRSDEVSALRDEADIIITNPPFSLFIDFFDWVVTSNKKFLIMGNMNAITYKNVFPKLKDASVQLGYNPISHCMLFDVPDAHLKELTAKTTKDAYRIVDGRAKACIGGICWFTNLEHSKRHEFLPLNTMQHNLDYNRSLRNKLEKTYNCAEYPHYTNFDALEVPFVNCIPSDYKGVMGVPVTFMDKFNPEQFELIGYEHDLAGNGGLGRRSHFLINEHRTYKRILIRLKSPQLRADQQISQAQTITTTTTERVCKREISCSPSGQSALVAKDLASRATNTSIHGVVNKHAALQLVIDESKSSCTNLGPLALRNSCLTADNYEVSDQCLRSGKRQSAGHSLAKTSNSRLTLTLGGLAGLKATYRIACTASSCLAGSSVKRSCALPEYGSSLTLLPFCADMALSRVCARACFEVMDCRWMQGSVASGVTAVVLTAGDVLRRDLSNVTALHGISWSLASGCYIQGGDG